MRGSHDGIFPQHSTQLTRERPVHRSRETRVHELREKIWNQTEREEGWDLPAKDHRRRISPRRDACCSQHSRRVAFYNRRSLAASEEAAKNFMHQALTQFELVGDWELQRVASRAFEEFGLPAARVQDADVVRALKDVQDPWRMEPSPPAGVVAPDETPDSRHVRVVRTLARIIVLDLANRQMLCRGIE